MEVWVQTDANTKVSVGEQFKSMILANAKCKRIKVLETDVLKEKAGSEIMI